MSLGLWVNFFIRWAIWILGWFVTLVEVLLRSRVGISHIVPTDLSLILCRLLNFRLWLGNSINAWNLHKYQLNVNWRVLKHIDISCRLYTYLLFIRKGMGTIPYLAEWKPSYILLLMWILEYRIQKSFRKKKEKKERSERKKENRKNSWAMWRT